MNTNDIALTLLGSDSASFDDILEICGAGPIIEIVTADDYMNEIGY